MIFYGCGKRFLFLSDTTVVVAVPAIPVADMRYIHGKKRFDSTWRKSCDTYGI